MIGAMRWRVLFAVLLTSLATAGLAVAARRIGSSRPTVRPLTLTSFRAPRCTARSMRRGGSRIVDADGSGDTGGNTVSV